MNQAKIAGNRVEYNSPGKIILSGEHSVAHGKAAIAAAIDVRCHVSLSDSDNVSGVATTVLSFQPDCFHEICFANVEIAKLFPLYFSSSESAVSNLPSKEQLEALENFVAKHTNERFLSLAAQCFLHCLLSTCSSQEYLKNKNYHISVISEIPLGAGLGSSAAFNTATAACVLDLFGIIKWTKGDECPVEDQGKINKLAFAAEHIVHGNPSGVDTYVSCYGRPILFNKKSFQEEIYIPNFQILIVNTKEERNTRILVEKVSKLKEKNVQIFDDLIERMDLCTKSIVSILHSANIDPCEFWKDFADQISVNQYLLKQLGVSTEKLDKIVEIAQSENCPAKLTGAGGGGCAIVILPPSWEAKCPGLKEKLEERFYGLGFDVVPATLSLKGVQRVC